MQLIRNLNVEVEVKTKEILEKVNANRELHMAVYAEAKANYLATVKAGLEKVLAKLEKGDYKTDDYVSVSFNPPKDYTEVYDNAIAMFEMETRETMLLDQEQFTCLILDKWHWKGDFMASNSGYVSEATNRALVGSSRR